jgi:hypothetical protein
VLHLLKTNLGVNFSNTTCTKVEPKINIFYQQSDFDPQQFFQVFDQISSVMNSHSNIATRL